MIKHFLSKFEMVVRQLPNKTALQLGNTYLSYQSLDHISDIVASQLVENGISKGSFVLLEANKSFTTIAVMIGIIKTRCAYISVDPTIPNKRWNYILQQSGAKVAFVRRLFVVSKTGREINSLSLADIDAMVANPTEINHITGINHIFARQPFEYSFDDPAYCLYTSGSTGYPKGVIISHRAIARFFHDIDPVMQLNQDAVCLNTAPYYFDVSLLDTLHPLTHGATVFISPDICLPQYNLATISNHKISHMCGVSSTLNLLFGQMQLLKQFELSSLQTVMTGAEILNPITLQQLIKAAPNIRIINGYGPTEATCVCIAFEINQDNVFNYKLYPIGKPLTGIDIKVHDEQSKESKQGELLIAGEQLMQGYLNAGDDTNAAFSIINGIKYYRTGDIVSYDDSGYLIFHGRKDSQVKLNGYRIDLNEIKKHILSHEAIIDAYVFVVNKSLSVIYASRHGEGQQKQEAMLKQWLSQFLPIYMQPKNWLKVEGLPKLPSGKVNIKQLESYLEQWVHERESHEF